MHDSTVTDKIYDILKERKGGVSLQLLAQLLDLKIGTIRKNIARMEKELLVIRTIHKDQFVYKLTDADSIFAARAVFYGSK